MIYIYIQIQDPKKGGQRLGTLIDLHVIILACTIVHVFLRESPKLFAFVKCIFLKEKKHIHICHTYFGGINYCIIYLYLIKTAQRCISRLNQY